VTTSTGAGVRENLTQGGRKERLKGDWLGDRGGVGKKKKKKAPLEKKKCLGRRREVIHLAKARTTLKKWGGDGARNRTGRSKGRKRSQKSCSQDYRGVHEETHRKVGKGDDEHGEKTLGNI